MVVVGKLMPFQKKINASFRILDVNTMEIVSTADGVFDDILVFFNKIPEIVKKLTGEIKNISTTSNITTSKTESSSVSTNVSTPKTRSTSSTSSISIPRTSNFSTSSTSTSGTIYNNKANEKTYNIGDDGPGGGIIFHYSQYGFDVYEPDGSVKKCHYLEVSKFDLGAISWCTQKDFETSCCDITTLEKLGSGKINTFKIIKSSHKGGTITKENCAALACHSYSTATTKAGDWFLPSIDELIFLNKNLGKRVLLSNTTNNNYYWSSSQLTNSIAWFQRFSAGSQYRCGYKYNTFSVRAVRAF